MTDLLDDDGLLDLRRGSRTDPQAMVDELNARRAKVPAQNSALREWTAPRAQQPEGCHLCGRAPRMVCQACGRQACSADSWVMLALCRTCATEERMRARDSDVSENWLG